MEWGLYQLVTGCVVWTIYATCTCTSQYFGTKYFAIVVMSPHQVNSGAIQIPTTNSSCLRSVTPLLTCHAVVKFRSCCCNLRCYLSFPALTISAFAFYSFVWFFSFSILNLKKGRIMASLQYFFFFFFLKKLEKLHFEEEWTDRCQSNYHWTSCDCLSSMHTSLWFCTWGSLHPVKRILITHTDEKCFSAITWLAIYLSK